MNFQRKLQGGLSDNQDDIDKYVVCLLETPDPLSYVGMEEICRFSPLPPKAGQYFTTNVLAFLHPQAVGFPNKIDLTTNQHFCRFTNEPKELLNYISYQSVQTVRDVDPESGLDMMNVVNSGSQMNPI